MIVETVWLHVFITEGGESIAMGENAVERPGAFEDGVVGFETDAENNRNSMAAGLSWEIELQMEHGAFGL